MSDTFGPYNLIRPIASGGMAEVHLAQGQGHDGRRRTLALKMVHPQFTEDDDFIDALVEEAKLSVKLDHPAIAAIFDLGRIDGRYYLTMEFVDGKDLFQFLVRTSTNGVYLPLEHAVHIAAQVGRGLDYAHSRRDDEGRPMAIVHRDVSPQNVLISCRGDVKICDFGIAKAAGRASRTRAGVIKGKFSYMSPEQAWGDPLDSRSDIFSAGICLWEAICGEMMYSEEDSSALLDQVRKADIRPPSSRRTDVPPDLDAIVLKALDREPARRWQTGAALADALEDWLQSNSPGYDPRALGELLVRSFPDFEPFEAGAAALEPAPESPVAETRQMSTMARDDFTPDAEHSMIFKLSDIRRLDELRQGADAPAPAEDAPPPLESPPPPASAPGPAPPEATTMLRPEELLGSLGRSEGASTLPPGAQRPAGLQPPPADEPAPGLAAATVMLNSRDIANMAPTAAAAGPPAATGAFEQKTAFLSTQDPAIAAALDAAQRRHEEIVSGDEAPSPAAPQPETVMARKPPIEDAPSPSSGVRVVKATKAQAVTPAPLPETVAAQPAPVAEAPPAETQPKAQAPLKAATPTPTPKEPKTAPAAKEPKTAPAAKEAPPATAEGKVAAAKAKLAKKKEKAGDKKKASAAGQAEMSKMGRVASGSSSKAFSPGVILTLAGVLVFGGITLNYIIGMFSVAHGGAKITSDPPGAAITLNGKALKETTPHTVRGLPTDKGHALTLELDGFQRHEEEFEIAADDVSPVHVILDPNPGSLRITSNPTGANVFLDGRRRGQTPIRVEDLPRDLDVPVVLKKKGYQDLQRIHVWSKQHDKLHFTLERKKRRRRR